MGKYIRSLIALTFIISCLAGEVIKFDDDNSIKEMLQIVKSELKKGETKAVMFSTGEFHLVRPTENKGENQKIANLAQPLSVELANRESLQDVKEWCESNKVKWVHLRVDLDIKSQLFFKLEKQLRSKGIQYILSSVDAKKDGIVTLEHIPGIPVIPTIPK